MKLFECVLFSYILILLQYFYNPMHQHFMYWDGEKQTYIPVASTAQTPADAQQAYAQSANDKKDNRPEQPEKVKVAKKIVKVCHCIINWVTVANTNIISKACCF